MRPGDLAFLIAGFAEPERAARIGELRALALVYLGQGHPAIAALAAAASEPAATERALDLIDKLPALRRRRLLAAAGALHQPAAHR
jgi:hypothetical protein